LLIPCCLSSSLKFRKIFFNYKFSFIIFPLVFIFWIIAIVAETNRAPLDFAEGERELVSGFKTEYRSLSFTFLFLGEYGNMVISRIVTSIIFFGKQVFLPVLSVLFLFFFVWFRRTFPRYRYDLFMKFS
jgi:NADH-quinone oxidoreductase subunit H